MPANHTATHADAETELLDNLLSDLQGDDAGADEVIELPVEDDTEVAVESVASAAPSDDADDLQEFLAMMGDLPEAPVAAAQADEDAAVQADAPAAADAEPDAIEDIEAAIADAEREAAKVAMYAEQPADVADDGSAPLTTPEDVANAPVLDAKATAKAAKAAAAATKKAEKAAAKAAADAEMGIEPKDPAAPKAPSVPRATSVTHKPGALLMVKLGMAARDYLTFSMADIELDAEALYAKQDAFIARMNDRDAIADKVKEKAIMFLTWMQNGGELNTVLKRALTVLHAKNELTSGDAGNLQLNLLAKPYSLGTARSQASQVFMLFPELGMCLKTKGHLVPNPDSVLLPLAYAKLGL